MPSQLAPRNTKKNETSKARNTKTDYTGKLGTARAEQFLHEFLDFVANVVATIGILQQWPARPPDPWLPARPARVVTSWQQPPKPTSER